jgi:hypothetical protein
MKELLSGEVVTVWEGLGQGDSDFGNAPWYTVGYYLTNGEATEAVKTSGGWGSPGKVRSAQAIKSGDLYFLFEKIEITPVDLKKIRDQALAKLTPAEKKALGL